MGMLSNMIKQPTISINELVAIAKATSGLPQTKRGLQKFLGNKGVMPKEVHPTKGAVYDVSNLPSPLKPASLNRTTTPDKDKLCPPQACYNKRRGRLLILQHYEQYTKQHNHLKIHQQLTEFCYQYNHGLLLIDEDVKNSIKKLSPTTIRRWMEERRQNKDLVPLYGNRKDTGVLECAEDGAIKDALLALLTSNSFLQIGHIRDDIRSQFGDVINYKGKQVPLPSYRSFSRTVQKLKEDYKVALLSIHNPDKYKGKYEVSVGNASMKAIAPNHIWEIDASPTDALTLEGRMNLYMITDIYTRRMKVLITKTPYCEGACELIRQALVDWGMPKTIITDNGADFVANFIEITLLQAGIYHDVSPPYDPKYKPHVERAIGTLQRGLMRLVPGFCGHNVADRKAIQERKAFAERLGERDEKAFKVELNGDELQEICNEWVEGKYHHKPHAGLNGKTPADMIKDYAGDIDYLEDEELLKMLFAPIKGNPKRTVTKKGVKYDGYYYNGIALIDYRGQEVIVRYDPRDSGVIYLVDVETYKFIGEAECPEVRGINPAELAKLMKKESKKHDAKERRNLRQLAQHYFKDGETILSRQREIWRDTANMEQLPTQNKKLITPPSTPDVDDSNIILLDAAKQRDERIAKAIKIENQLSQEHDVSADDAKFIANYRKTAEYRVSVAPALTSHHNDKEQAL